jgi:DNA-binding transcriptional LysR family regulator
MCLPYHRNAIFVKSKERLKDLARSTPAIQCSHAAMLTKLALAGGGICLRSRWDVGPALQDKSLVQILADHPVESFGDIVAMMPSKKLISHRVRVFYDYLVDEAAKALR